MTRNVYEGFDGGGIWLTYGRSSWLRWKRLHPGPIGSVTTGFWKTVRFSWISLLADRTQFLRVMRDRRKADKFRQLAGSVAQDL